MRPQNAERTTMTATNAIEPSNRRAGLLLLLVFVLLAAGFVATGWFYYRNYTQHHHAEAEQQLSVIADMKVDALALWRRERLGDGGIAFQNAAFTSQARRFLDKPADADAQRSLLNWMGNLTQYSHYDRVWLLDAQGVTRLSVPAGEQPFASVTLQLASKVLRSGQMAFQDFYRNEHDQRVYLAVMVPILDESDTNHPLGTLILRMDPETYLYPFLKRWPTLSRTAETLLVRREGNEVLFLNELRFQTNTALILRAPLDRVTLPAGQAVLGREGAMSGIDYRGVPVLAVMRAVPDSPWALVARMDAEEVYAPVRQRFWQIVAFIGALLLAAGACMGLVWRQKHVRLCLEKAESADTLRASEVRYRRLFESAKDGILILDAETGMVVDVNPFLIEMLGYSHEVFLGKKIWELGFFKNIVANQDNFVELQQKGYVRYEDMALEGSDGTRHEVEFVSNVYLVNKKKVIQCNIRDISERVRSSLSLQEKNMELEHFLYTASHDLKTPVVTVRTFLGYLKQDMAIADAARIEKDLRFIHLATDKMARLLDDLLEISRIGRVVSPPVSVTFRHLANEAVGVVAGRIAEQGVTVQVGENDVTLLGDRLRLAQIWQNLVENACKFMGPQQGPRIEIGVEERGTEAVFFVRDNGIGIDPRYHAKVFSLFDKLDPKAEGTGLGLALAKRIVELYQGRIWVESPGLGQGACFYFTLPGARRAAELKQEQTA